MISRNSKLPFVFLLMGLFVVGEIGAIAQSKSSHTAEFNAPAYETAIVEFDFSYAGAECNLKAVDIVSISKIVCQIRAEAES